MRLPVVAVGASEPSVVVDGGVKAGIVSDSGESAGEIGSGTNEAVRFFFFFFDMVSKNKIKLKFGIKA